MIKIIGCLSLVALVFSSCGLFQSEDTISFISLIPDDTPFIVGILETTADTVHHYPEVFVGYVRNPEGLEVEFTRVAPGVWWPVTSAQVAGICSYMDLIRAEENQAEVSVTGPINTSFKKTVSFAPEGNGIYGDLRYELPLVPLGSYKLEVTLPDGRHYEAPTTLPELPVWEVPDSIEVPLKLTLLSDNTYYEQNQDTLKLYYEPASTAPFTTGQINYSNDWEGYNVPKGKFLFENRGNFLRAGARYFIQHNSSPKHRNWYDPRWNLDENMNLVNYRKAWMYIAQLNADMSERWFYHNIFVWFGGSSEGPWNDQDHRQLNALVERDTTYLFDISNILKVDANGEVLPKAQTDAIGVFGGYSAAYRTTTLIPIRSWDPDTLDWGK